MGIGKWWKGQTNEFWESVGRPRKSSTTQESDPTAAREDAIAQAITAEILSKLTIEESKKAPVMEALAGLIHIAVVLSGRKMFLDRSNTIKTKRDLLYEALLTAGIGDDQATSASDSAVAYIIKTLQPDKVQPKAATVHNGTANGAPAQVPPPSPPRILTESQKEDRARATAKNVFDMLVFTDETEQPFNDALKNAIDARIAVIRATPEEKSAAEADYTSKKSALEKSVSKVLVHTGGRGVGVLLSKMEKAIDGAFGISR